MLKETKIGDAVIVEQTTYYYYASEADRKKDKFFLCTSDRKKINEVKRQIRKNYKLTEKEKINKKVS
jgi:hypothetical protein